MIVEIKFFKKYKRKRGKKSKMDQSKMSNS